MVVDYEAAWAQLAKVVASKTQHGREGLLTEMAQIADEHRVPAGELSRLLRLYGVEVERARSMSAESERLESEDFAGGFASPTERALAAHHGPIGGHDGGSNGGAGRSNGRRAV